MTATRELYVNLGVRDKPLLRLDVPSGRVWVGDERVHLTLGEFKCLAVLIRRAGEAVPYADIAHAVYGAPEGVRKTPVVVSRLRRKLGDPGRGYITTVERVGYRVDRSLVAQPSPVLDSYAVTVAAGRPVMFCPRNRCTGDLLAGEVPPVTVDRLQQIAAWHELDHWAETS